MLIEKLTDVPLGDVLLKQFDTRTRWPIVEQLNVEVKKFPDDFNVQDWLDPEITGVKELFAA